ncbi:hypothetical protein BC938DRAFT_478821 [Jimgerdemannia flammicorona]|uniref:Uncharacterized protein n=1 Tax=Jimgerdemannia flammicorona TaxID=994334 RepID=A0A433QM78_9FUNG|nr:hypothetical protein BC938DRAFT_478821 [Jimgerdemannia flammicorona]
MAASWVTPRRPVMASSWVTPRRPVMAASWVTPRRPKGERSNPVKSRLSIAASRTPVENEEGGASKNAGMATPTPSPNQKRSMTASEQDLDSGTSKDSDSDPFREFQKAHPEAAKVTVTYSRKSSKRPMAVRSQEAVYDRGDSPNEEDEASKNQSENEESDSGQKSKDEITLEDDSESEVDEDDSEASEDSVTDHEDAYFTKTSPEQWSFIDYYRHRSASFDFSSDFKKEAFKLKKNLDNLVHSDSPGVRANANRLLSGEAICVMDSSFDLRDRCGERNFKRSYNHRRNVRGVADLWYKIEHQYLENKSTIRSLKCRVTIKGTTQKMMEDLAQETVAESRASPLGKREQNHDELLLSSKKQRKIITKDSVQTPPNESVAEDLEEGENVAEDLDEGEDVTAIVFGRGDKPKWLLADDTDVSVMFEAYRTKVGESDYLANRYIMELIKTSPISDDICKTFGETIWLELCAACGKKRDRHAPPDKALAYLDILMTSNIKDARRAVLEPICSEYNIKEHYDLNYIQTVVNKL